MVKLPKDLQKKKQSMEANLEQLKKMVLKTFKTEFIKTKKKFQDERRVIFKKVGDKGMFSSNLINEQGEARDMGGYIHVYYGKTIIEIFFNHKQLDKDFFTRPDFKQRINDFKQHFKHVAHHEFGHSFFIPTTSDLKPKEVKDYLNKIGVQQAREEPQELKTEFLDVYRDSQLCRTVAVLKNVDLTSLYNEFKEFHAYYMVKIKEICNFVPNKFLEWNYNTLKNSIRNFRTKHQGFLSFISEQEHFQILPHDPFFALYHDVMSLSYNFFIYGEWDKLIGLFNEHNMTYFLNFMHTINEIFKAISDKHTDIDNIQKIIIKLSKIMDDINYEGLIFTNKFNEKHQQELNKFRQELEQAN